MYKTVTPLDQSIVWITMTQQKTLTSNQRLHTLLGHISSSIYKFQIHEVFYIALQCHTKIRLDYQFCQTDMGTQMALPAKVLHNTQNIRTLNYNKWNKTITYTKENDGVQTEIQWHFVVEVCGEDWCSIETKCWQRKSTNENLWLKMGYTKSLDEIPLTWK